jgi:hypothetical protein
MMDKPSSESVQKMPQSELATFGVSQKSPAISMVSAVDMESTFAGARNRLPRA